MNILFGKIFMRIVGIENKNMGWFTLIEILIAIFIFSVWILAVFQLMTSNLSVIWRSRIEVNANILAQESMALLFNLRDTNIKRWLPADCLLIDLKHFDDAADLCDSYMGDLIGDLIGDNKYLLLGLDGEGGFFVDVVNNVENTKLYLSSWNISFVYGGGEESIFSRYIKFDNVVDGGNDVDKNKILKVISIVIYNNIGQTGEVVLESIIWFY